MEKLKRIVAPTDMSELSRVGVRHALEMAKSSGADVIVHHVIPFEEATPYFYATGDESSSPVEYRPLPEVVEECKRHLAKFLRENFGDLMREVTVRPEVELGLPYKRIVERALEEGADMIVISTHGRTGLLRMLIGSVAERVVRLAHCPVLVVRPAKEAAEAKRSAA